MNRKLSAEDRKAIRKLFGSLTHEEIAEAFGVSTRTIDREAAWLRAHTVTIRTIPIMAGGRIVSVSAGASVDPGELRQICEDAERMIAEYDTEQFREELRKIEEEGNRILSEIEAVEIALRESRISNDVRSVGIPIPPETVAVLRAVYVRFMTAGIIPMFSEPKQCGSDISNRHDLRRP